MAQESTSRRSFLKTTGAVAGAAAVAGCSSDDTPETEGTDEGSTDTTPSQQGDPNTLYRHMGTATTWDPVAATDTESGRIIQQLFDSLTTYPSATTTVENLLATNIELSDDFLTYTIELKDGVQFHNGDELTASDFVYSWERLAQSDNSRRAYYILDSIGAVHETDEEGNYVPESLAVEAVDEKTVRLELQSPFHATLEMLAYTALAPIPEGLLGDIEGYDGEVGYDEFAASAPVGAGPFEFDTYTEGTEVAVTAFDGYHGDGADIEKIHWQIIEDDNAQYNYAMNRNADLFEIPTSFYDPEQVSVEETDDQGRKLGTYGPVRNGDTVNYVGVPTINTFYIGFNMAEVPEAVRKAVAYVANQDLFIDEVFKGRGEAAYHFTPPSIYPGGAADYQSHVEEQYPYGVGESRLEEAKSVMEDAGYGEDNRYTLNWTQYDSDTWQQLAQILRDQLSSAYIDMEIERAQFSTLTSRGREGSLEVYTLGWIADWPAPDNFLQLLNPPLTDTGGEEAPVSYINWDDLDTEASQQATDAYATVRDNQAPNEDAKATRDEAYVQIEEANWEDVGFLPMYHEISEYFWYDTVADFEPPGGMGLSRKSLNNVSLDK